MKQLILLFCCCISFLAHSQWKTKNPVQFQQELNEWYQNEETSPFKDKAVRENVIRLNYFNINNKYNIEATFYRTENGEISTYNTSAGTERKLQQYGYVEFEWKGKNIQLKVLEELTVYDPKYADFLEIPFFDKTNGKTTYGGGRYLGVWRNELQNGETVELNFNLAFNPYCAYTTGYACLIPPRENTIPFAVKAGVKKGLKLHNPSIQPKH